MVPNGRLSSPYFGALPAQPLRRILMDPTDKVLEERGNPFVHAHKGDSLSPPLPTLLGLVTTRSVALLSAVMNAKTIYPTAEV